jgi:O-antigen ligase
LFGLFLYCQFVLMYFYIVNHVRTWADIHSIIVTMVVCLLLESALMVMQYFMGITLDLGMTSSYSVGGPASKGITGPRIGGTIGGPNSAAAYLTPALIITFGAYLTGRLVDRRLALGAFSLGTIALIATASRTAWGGFFIGMLILLSRAVWTDAGKKAILILLIGVLFVGIFFGAQMQTRLAAAATDRTRPELATMAYNIMKDYPLGVGENNYDQVMGDKYAHPNWVGHTHYPVHNKYLQVWTETGPQGLVAFSLLLIAAAWQARRWLFRTGIAPHFFILAAAILGALVGYAFHMRTESFSSRATLQQLWFIITMTVVVNQLIAQTESDVVSARSHESGGRLPPIKLKSEESR